MPLPEGSAAAAGLGLGLPAADSRAHYPLLLSGRALADRYGGSTRRRSVTGTREAAARDTRPPGITLGRLKMCLVHIRCQGSTSGQQCARNKKILNKKKFKRKQKSKSKVKTRSKQEQCLKCAPIAAIITCKMAPTTVTAAVAALGIVVVTVKAMRAVAEMTPKGMKSKSTLITVTLASSVQHSRAYSVPRTVPAASVALEVPAALVVSVEPATPVALADLVAQARSKYDKTKH